MGLFGSEQFDRVVDTVGCTLLKCVAYAGLHHICVLHITFIVVLPAGVVPCTRIRYFEVLVMQHKLYVTMGARRSPLVLQRQTLDCTLRGLECVRGALLVF